MYVSMHFYVCLCPPTITFFLSKFRFTQNAHTHTNTIKQKQNKININRHKDNHNNNNKQSLASELGQLVVARQIKKTQDEL